MKIQTIQEGISFLSSNSLTVELFFLIKEEDEVVVKRGRLAKEIQLSIVKDVIKPFLDKEIRLAEAVMDYDPALSPDKRTLFTIAASEIEQYSLNANLDIPEFNCRKGYDKVWGYMLKVSNGENEIVAVRKRFGSHTLKSGISLWLSNGQFTKFDNDIFTIDEHIDAFLLNGEFIVFQRTNFERCFLFESKLRDQAIRNVKELVSTYKILEISDENIEQFLDKPTISKLRKIDMSLIEDGTMSFDNLTIFCTGWKITIKHSEDKFTPKNKGEFKVFVKLLSDDFLESGLTERKYDSHSKEILES